MEIELIDQRRGILSALSLTNIKPNVFVETGTLQGDTTEIVRELFRRVLTIELSLVLYQNACNRFLPFENVECLYGDSGFWVEKVAERIQEPIFWLLDAHWFCTKDRSTLPPQAYVASHSPMPLLKELEAISKRKHQDIVVIDDLHAFRRGGIYRKHRITQGRVSRILQPANVKRLRDSLAMLLDKKHV